MTHWLCVLCGDELQGKEIIWKRVVYRLDGGNWMAVAEGPLPGNRFIVTIGRIGAKEIRHYVFAHLPELYIVVQPPEPIEWGTAHATCAEELVQEANARKAAASS